MLSPYSWVISFVSLPGLHSEFHLRLILYIVGLLSPELAKKSLDRTLNDVS